ncbi:hypothetical protein [Streptomyces sp. NPDC047928]|uniref:hypothetical protein n=1 Tax=unclassified Streptomyces TaxID=2593676 RepID=UPI0037229129
MNHESDEQDSDYSATALASHWIQRPDDPPEPRTEPYPVVADARPDRVDGVVLRFGPGVTAAALDLRAAHAPAAPDSRPPRRGSAVRRFALPAVVLLCVLAFLAWQRYAPTVAVRDVAVRTAATGPGCEGTADVVGVVTTDGRPGTLVYRWVRSDGTVSEELRETVRRGQTEARLHLLWTFSGEGEYRARAELEILSPGRRLAGADFVYTCPSGGA